MRAWRPRRAAVAGAATDAPRRRIAVLAPHPDDDAIGCGGALARAAARGASVRAIYLTDGAASHPRSKRFPPRVLRDVREREARAGLRELGVAEAPVFLRVPDGTAAALEPAECERVVAALAGVLEAERCELVFGPWLREPHPDHAAAARLLHAALSCLARPPQHLMYAVWLHEFGTGEDLPPAALPVLDVPLTGAERARKRAAILAHASQASALIDDDPDGFRISPSLLARWTGPVERFYAGNPVETGTNVR